MTTKTTTTTPTASTTPHLTDIRAIMLAQMQALRSASTDDVEVELKRSKGVNELSQTMINSAKVEIEFLRVTKQSQSNFLSAPGSASAPTLPAPAPQLQNNPSKTDDTKPVVTRTTWVDVTGKGNGK